jgi:hypothetical protein
MEMSGQQHVYAAFGQNFHGEASTPHYVIALHAGRQVKRMMRDHDLYVRRGHSGETGPKFGELLAIDAAIFPGKSAGGVYARHGDFRVGVEGLEIGADEAPVTVKLAHEPREQVMERDVVISRHDDFREWDGLEKLAGGFVLSDASALGKIA